MASTKSGEIYRISSGNYTFLCIHCGFQLANLKQTLYHIETHYDNLDNDGLDTEMETKDPSIMSNYSTDSGQTPSEQQSLHDIEQFTIPKHMKIKLEAELDIHDDSDTGIGTKDTKNIYDFNRLETDSNDFSPNKIQKTENETDFAFHDMLEDEDQDDNDDDEDESLTPKELIEASKLGNLEILPSASKLRYEKVYGDFRKWQETRNATTINRSVLVAYFQELGQKIKPSSLWAYYSMLKATIRALHNIDISKFTQITAFIKSKSNGYIPIKARIFSEKEIQRFLDEAPDEVWLDVKVACIFAVSGACRTNELQHIKLEDIEHHSDMLVVRMHKAKTKGARSFTITGQFYDIVQKYAFLRPVNIKENRFFVNYQRGKCTAQFIGKNKFSNMPRRIATYLQLPESERYTGNSFRRTSRTIFANTVATMDVMQRHCSLNSNAVAEQYIEDSPDYKNRTGEPIPGSVNAASTSMNSTMVSNFPSTSGVVTEFLISDVLEDESNVLQNCGNSVQEEIRFPSTMIIQSYNSNQ